MKKALKYILAVLWTAWTGALTIVTGIAMIAGVFTLSEKLFNNNVVVSVILLILLIGATLSVGDSVKSWLKGED